LVRQRDHKSAKEELLEDFLDYQADKVIHQISIDSDNFNFVLHRQLPKGTVLVGESLGANLRFAVLLFA